MLQCLCVCQSQANPDWKSLVGAPESEPKPWMLYSWSESTHIEKCSYEFIGVRKGTGLVVFKHSSIQLMQIRQIRLNTH